jgi:hypothetical protein
MFNYRPNFIPNKFVIIGAGGTGGRLVPLLAQFVKSANWIHDPKIFIVDHDTVEDKNLVRQNFIKLDLNKPKARVLAERYGRAFDIEIVPVVEKVESFRNIGHMYLGTENLVTGSQEMLDGLHNTVVFICVDSANARRAILSHICRSHSTTMLVLDAGNENDFGQVVIYNPVIFTPSSVYGTNNGMDHISLENDVVPIEAKIANLPLPTKFYNEMKDNPAAANCAELDQTLAINAAMATTMMGVVQNFLYSKPISYHRINVTLTNGSIPQYYTFKQFKEDCYDIFNAKGECTKFETSIGVTLPHVDNTREITQLDKEMTDYKEKFKAKALPPLTEITGRKKKEAKEPA